MSDPYFQTRFKFCSEKEMVWQVLCDHFQQYIPRDSKVLDAGAGYCHFINNIKAGEKHACDLDREVLKYANPEVITRVAPVFKTAYENNFFDTIFTSNLLEHLSQEEILLTLKEFNRILKPGGKLIILSPNFKLCYKSYFDDYTHKSIITDKSLADLLLAHGFEIEICRKKFLPFSADSKAPKNKLIIKMYLSSPWKPFAGQMLFIARKIKEVENL